MIECVLPIQRVYVGPIPHHMSSPSRTAFSFSLGLLRISVSVICLCSTWDVQQFECAVLALICTKGNVRVWFVDMLRNVNLRATVLV